MGNMITENSYLSAPQTQLLMEKVWKQRITALENSQGSKMSLEKKAALATCLENTRNKIKYMESTATQSADIGQYKRFALDMVGAIVPNMIAFDICSVQAINNRVAMVNYIKYNYGTAKGATAAGTNFASALNYNESDANYTSDHVEGEELAAHSSNTYSGMLQWSPVAKGTVTITLNGVVVKDDGNGALKAATGLTGDGTIDYSTGEYTFTTSAESGVALASYDYNNEHVPASKLPSITLSIESLPITTKTRRLAALWGFEAQYELQKEYGESIEELISTTAAGEIAHEIDMEICNDIYDFAGTSPDLNWSSAAPVGVSQQDHFDSFAIKINQASNKIYQNTRKVRANFMICGTNVATVLQSIRTFKPSNVTEFRGPYFAGNLGQIKVFVAPDYDPNAYVLGYKGDSLLDAGYIYAPYMPVMTTSMVQLEDMMGRKGWATSYGKRRVNSKMYIRGTITNL